MTWCAFTRKWIVSSNGRPHRCNNVSFKRDLAFRHWGDALKEANRIASERIKQAVDGVWHE